MMISSTYSQSLTWTFSATMTSNVVVPRRTDDDPARPAPVKETPAPAADDRVELSHDATAHKAVTPSTRAQSTRSQRGDALFRALDEDRDGSITEQEFTEGALALLRTAGARHRHRTEDGEGDGDARRATRESRLTNRLERVFERVDANEDGAIDKDELTSALARRPARRPREESDRPVAQPPTAPAPTPDEGASPIGTATSVTRLTVVVVAMQQYASVAQLPDAAPQSASHHPQSTSRQSTLT